MKSSSDYILLENEVTEEGEYTKTFEWEGQADVLRFRHNMYKQTQVRC